MHQPMHFLQQAQEVAYESTGHKDTRLRQNIIIHEALSSFQLYNRYMGQDVKQARPITSRPGMSALLAL